MAKIKLVYAVAGKKKSSSVMENEDFSIKCEAVDGVVKYYLKPKKDIELVNFKVVECRQFSDDERVLQNGYQSWTDTMEMTKNDTIRKVGWRNKIYMGSPILNAYGDGDFKKYVKGKGRFHSCSYTYIRDGKKFTLLGSLNEKTGYTFFNFDLRGGKITFEKDVEGVLPNGEYELLNYVTISGGEEEVFDKYFEMLKIAKPRVKRNCGYTSWYNYYQNVKDDIIVRDLASFAKSDVKMEIFQIDDGYQTAIGDWLSLDAKKFPNGLKVIVDEIHKTGMLAGLWLAPFAAQSISKLYNEHPDWMVHVGGKPVKVGGNWGGYYALDIENAEARAYLKKVFSTVLNEWGFDLVKLDFLCSSCFYPRNGKSRGQLMVESMEFLRELCGDKLILGCGVPLFPAFGKVDYCRIGPDMGLSWKDNTYYKMTSREDVTTRWAMCNTVFRRQLDGRAFVNDPDVFLLRDYNIEITDTQKKIIATVNKLFGNLLFVSDDISKYNDDMRAFFNKIMSDNEFSVQNAIIDEDKNLHIDYTFEGVKKQLVFSTLNGELIKGETI